MSRIIDELNKQKEMFNPLLYMDINDIPKDIRYKSLTMAYLLKHLDMTADEMTMAPIFVFDDGKKIIRVKTHGTDIQELVSTIGAEYALNGYLSMFLNGDEFKSYYRSIKIDEILNG